MKKQIRRNVFETNSSSVHSLTMCLQSDYDKWKNGEVLLFRGSGWCYPDNHHPINNHFYTKDEAIEFERSTEYPPNEDMDWDSEEGKEYLRKNEWFTYEDYNPWEYEEFYESYKTLSGENVVAFGYYGENR